MRRCGGSGSRTGRNSAESRNPVRLLGAAGQERHQLLAEQHGPQCHHDDAAGKRYCPGGAGPALQQGAREQGHHRVNQARQCHERHAQQPGLHRHGQGGLGADELRYEGHIKEQALGVDPAGAHPLQEGAQLCSGGLYSGGAGRVRAEARAAPGPEGSHPQPQQVARAGQGNPAQDPGHACQHGGQPGHQQDGVKDVSAAEPGNRGDETALPQARRDGVGPVHPRRAGQGCSNHQEGKEQLRVHRVSPVEGLSGATIGRIRP